MCFGKKQNIAPICIPIIEGYCLKPCTFETIVVKWHKKRYRRKNILRFYRGFIHFMFVIFVCLYRALSLCRYLVCGVETVLSFSDLSTELTAEICITLCFIIPPLKLYSRWNNMERIKRLVVYIWCYYTSRDICCCCCYKLKLILSHLMRTIVSYL